MSRDELLQLIRDKGEQRKMKVFEQAKFQTSDYARTQHIYTQLQNDKSQLENERDFYNSRVQGLQEDLQKSKQIAEQSQVDHRREEEKLQAVKANTSDTQSYVQTCGKYVEEVTE